METKAQWRVERHLQAAPPVLQLLGCFLSDDAPLGEVSDLLPTTRHFAWERPPVHSRRVRASFGVPSPGTLEGVGRLSSAGGTTRCECGHRAHPGCAGFTASRLCLSLRQVFCTGTTG